MSSELALSSLSRLLGWTYTVLWSLSFYPQVLINHRSKSVRGLSSDYVLLNLVGHSCYAAYNLVFLLSPTVQRQYRHRWGTDNVVQWNDAVFATHAALVSALTAWQWWRYRTPPSLPPTPRSRPSSRYEAIQAEEVQQEARHDGERISTPASLLLVAALSTLIATLGLLNLDTISALAFADTLAYIKLTVTLVKYLPQVVLNYTRKSTRGFSIENVLLDAAGGVLSLAQLLVDAQRLGGDWKGAVGDVGKLGLSFLSIGYDAILIVQHYLVYPSASTDTGRGTFSFLFSSSSSSHAGEDEEESHRGTERQRLLDPESSRRDI
ncbi:uncharacterized protein PFL1_04719 [Pseudozyma flocculosa PF-1]|uniref:Related to cystinosin n=2 Tax=Pseudozyma flocculosa TaxID=84751 RepID=A0A5C3F4L2_9BASI|nr:uncharacterized protein PFL1_04719 [Pseudozyma flocculosa PF-1]EPQ27581.1 hypothetical protein PFL1_04719 [Pseudozyma flocculosa PF-1]SPO39292.1 related to cystinosin [Pseudozyma flocculosa]